MSLDLAMLGETDEVEESVGISMAAHWRLFTAAKQYNLLLLQRMADYWGEVAYSPEEMPRLAEEISTLMSEWGRTHDLFPLLKSLIKLADIAESKGRGLEALPD